MSCRVSRGDAEDAENFENREGEMDQDAASATAAGPVTLDTVRRLALALPGVEEGISYGTVSFRVRGKLIARMREDGESLVVKCNFFERAYLMEAEPQTFHLNDHYHGYPYVLVRLANVRPEQLAEMLEGAWRDVAPRRLVAAYEKESSSG